MGNLLLLGTSSPPWLFGGVFQWAHDYVSFLWHEKYTIFQGVDF
jgi:hypothetical protein